MPYNSVTGSFHRKELCSRLSSSEVQFYTENGLFAFSTPFEGLGSTYDVNRNRLTGKPVVDFLLAFIELFARCYTAEALRANTD